MTITVKSLLFPDKLKLARELGGTDFTLDVTESEARNKITKITCGRGVDVVIDTVGLDSTINLAIDVLNKSGAIVVVGLFGKEIRTPLFQTIVKEYQIHGSLWGNYNEL